MNWINSILTCSRLRNIKLRTQMFCQPDGRQQLDQRVPGPLTCCYNGMAFFLQHWTWSSSVMTALLWWCAGWLFLLSVGIFLVRAEQLPYQAGMRSISISFSLSRLQTAATLTDGIKQVKEKQLKKRRFVECFENHSKPLVIMAASVPLDFMGTRTIFPEKHWEKPT